MHVIVLWLVREKTGNDYRKIWSGELHKTSVDQAWY